MTKPIPTITGAISIITLRKFVSLVKGVITDKETYPYATCLGYGDGNPSFTPDRDDAVSNYKRLIARPNASSPTQAVLTALGHIGSHKILFKDNPLHLLENAAVEQAEEFGNPQYAVRLSPRTWILVDLADYALIHGEQGCVLACYAQHRTIVNEVLRITKDAAEQYAR